MQFAKLIFAFIYAKEGKGMQGSTEPKSKQPDHQGTDEMRLHSCISAIAFGNGGIPGTYPSTYEN